MDHIEKLRQQMIAMQNPPRKYTFTLQELQSLYKYLEREFISYEDPILIETIKKIQKIVTEVKK